jgi:hypothetical protein
LFIFQQALRGQIMGMRIGKSTTRMGLALIMLGIVSQPAFANNKEKAKRAEPVTACNDCCRPAVRSMSESTPVRKGECAKVRRILM